MPAILIRLSILHINYILRDLAKTKILCFIQAFILYKLSVRYLNVKPVCVNAA